MKWPRPKWLPSLHDPGPPRLWRIGYALAACFAVAVAGLAALWLAAVALLNYPRLPHSKAISLHDTVGVAQLVFASVAGAGALVALVMAYRRQRVAETATAHDRTRVLNERFTTIAAQLGDDQPAVRLAGVHAMAGLADDWEENRQTCINVLCAYLRMPYEPDPGDEAATAERLAFRASREVRRTVIGVIAAHLSNDAAVSWQGLNFDFTGVVFDGGSFDDATFSGPSRVSFRDATFSGGRVSFVGATFSGDTVSFRGATFSGGRLIFRDATFSGRRVSFDVATFSGGTVNFDGATFSNGRVSFDAATFSGGTVSFVGATFSNGRVSFDAATFSGGRVSFVGATFCGGRVSFQSGSPRSPAAGSASMAPRFPAARSTSAAPRSPAAGSASMAPRFPAARSTSAAPRSPAARSTSVPPTGHIRRASTGRTRHHRG